MTVAEQIRELISKHPHASKYWIAERVGCNPKRISEVKYRDQNQAACNERSRRAMRALRASRSRTRAAEEFVG